MGFGYTPGGGVFRDFNFEAEPALQGAATGLACIGSKVAFCMLETIRRVAFLLMATEPVIA